MYILQNIRPALEKQMHMEEPISPESRLAACLYRLGRGDYLYTISELTALPRNIVKELLQIRACSNVQNRNPTACKIRNKMTGKFWAEHENGNVL